MNSSHKICNKWKSSPEIQTRSRAFHDACARQPTGEDFDDAKEILEIMKPHISSHMKEQGLFENKRYEHRGSTYEGVKVKKCPTNPDLEFDVMYVIKGGTDLEEHNSGSDGYANLKPKPGKESQKVFQKTMKDGFISASKTRNLFYGHLDKCDLSKIDTTSIGYEKGEITFEKSYHGPAIQIDVKRNASKFFAVDLAPHYDLCGKTGEEKPYVPKPPKNNPNYDRWLRSHSLEEKKLFDGIDRDNGCRKMVLRTLKAFCKRREATELACITSQQLKTVLLMATKIHPSWKQDEFGQRLMDTLKILENSLDNRYLAHFFMPGVNLFENMKDAAMHAMKCRLCRLGRNKELFMKLLEKETCRRVESGRLDSTEGMSSA